MMMMVVVVCRRRKRIWLKLKNIHIKKICKCKTRRKNKVNYFFSLFLITYITYNSLPSKESMNDCIWIWIFSCKEFNRLSINKYKHSKYKENCPLRKTHRTCKKKGIDSGYVNNTNTNRKRYKNTNERVMILKNWMNIYRC